MESTETTGAAGRLSAVIGSLPQLWQTYKRRALIGVAVVVAASAIYGAVSFFSDARAFVCGESQKEERKNPDTSADEFY